MKKKESTSLLILVWRWLNTMRIKVCTGLFQCLYRQHMLSATGQKKYYYWLNIVQCNGGGEKMLPCEYIFPTPEAALLHKKVVETSQTWSYVTTVSVISDVELSITDYRLMLEYDEDYQDLVHQMQDGPADTANRELWQDRKKLEKLNSNWMAEVSAARASWINKHQNGQQS